MDVLIKALAPAFAAGFAVQQLLEILNPVVDRIIAESYKKLVLGIVSFIAGLAIVSGAGLRILQPLGVNSAGAWDIIVSGLVISAGTEGINSIVKFLGYTKEKQKAEAADEHKKAGPEALARMERK